MTARTGVWPLSVAATAVSVTPTRGAVAVAVLINWARRAAASAPSLSAACVVCSEPIAASIKSKLSATSPSLTGCPREDLTSDMLEFKHYENKEGLWI